ncbi:MAG: peptidoglycan DD-metalloendopeptidase family protein [Campylobacter sp.]|nr:peptidoglycan DD-metalloendopeptidase family protein [Campylobacter sp.]
MMRIFALIFLLFSLSFASSASVEKFKWPSGVSLLQFMENFSIPLSTYYDLDKEDQELAAEVRADVECMMLKDPLGKIVQVLIPINDELQIQIYRDKKGIYKFIYTPIVYEQHSYALSIEITSSPSNDILKATGSIALANEFSSIFKNEVNFKKLQKGDRLTILYEQKTRLGRPFGGVKILAGTIEEAKKPKSLYYFEDKYYNETGKKVEHFVLTTPLVYTRISSRFTPKRFHPVLKRYRAHLGVDYAAPKGTKVNAAGNGKVTFVGRKNGYGNTVEINHGGGLVTLYAHLSGFAKGLKVGMSVKQGQLIAYVGSTGLSSGPHLHLGLYRNNQPVDPLKTIKITKSNFVSEEERKFKALVKDMNAKFDAVKDGSKNPAKFEPYENLVSIN